MNCYIARSCQSCKSDVLQVPALQAVPYIVPQQKLVNFLEIFVETLYGKIYSKYFAQDCPSWSETRSNNLQSPQLFQQQALPNPYASEHVIAITIFQFLT